MNITTAKTAELVAFYNQNSGRKAIKKFQDRATAETRVADLIREQAAPKVEAAAMGQVHAASAIPSHEAAKVEAAATSAPRSSAAEAIAASWLNSEVAAKRKQRSAVLVDGVEYRSVRAAHVALDLPLKDHIALRMHLKETGKPVEVDGREWVIIPLNY